MTVVVPFAKYAPMLPAVHAALCQDGWDADYRLMESESDYYELLAEMWAKGDTFCVVEHDIVVWPGALQALASCPALWCTLPYYCAVGWIVDGLGCTKFDRALIEQYPKFLGGTAPYQILDRQIAHRAEALGLKPHVHRPGVTNLNTKY